MESRAFRRVESVSFLGSVDYYNRHKSRYSTWYFSRSDHTKGVLSLTESLIERIKIDKIGRLYLIAAAICHDLGHSPFSHSTERAYKKINPRINHRVILEVILRDPSMGVEPVLSDFCLNSDRVMAISVGGDDEFGWVFDNPINVDTLDGISRFLMSFRFNLPFDTNMAVVSLSKLFRNESVGHKETRNLDKFWEVKGSFYEQFLNTGVYARFEDAYIDLVLKKKKEVDILDYLKVDTDLENEIGLGPDIDLHDSVPRGRANVFYEIDEAVELKSIGDLYKRYRRGKVGDESAGIG